MDPQLTRPSPRPRRAEGCGGGAVRGLGRGARSSGERAAAGAARPGRTGGWAPPGTGAPPRPDAFGRAREWEQRWERDPICPSAEEGVEAGEGGRVEGGKRASFLSSHRKTAKPDSCVICQRLRL